MAKPSTPLFSFKARGTIANALTFQKSGTNTLVRKKPIPTDPQSEAQLSRRRAYAHFCQWWSLLTVAEKDAYTLEARPLRITGFNLFMRRCLSLLENCILYLPLDEAAGSVATDFSSYRNNGTIYGASWDTGYINGCLKLDGTDDFILIPSSPSLAALSALTICSVVKTPSTTAHMNMLSKYWHPNLREYNARIGATGAARYKPSFTVYDEDNNAYISGQTTNVVNLRDDAWHVVIWTWDGTPTSNSLTLIVDNINRPLTVSTAGVFVQIRDTGQPVRLGRQGNLDARDYTGLLDELFIWNTALPASQRELFFNLLAGVH